MKYALPPLETLKVFEAAARHLSFSKAADELCLTKSAVTYQIQKLEKNLDVSLFKRNVRQVFLSEAGQALYQTTCKIFNELEETLSQILPKENEQTVIIGVTTYVALRWLSPLMTEFTRLNPNVSIVFQHSVNAENFNLQTVDFAIRWVKMTSGKSSQRHLEIPMPLYAVCSPNLLKNIRIDQPKEGQVDPVFFNKALSKTTLLCEDRQIDLWDEWIANANNSVKNPKRIIADANVRTQAAIDGQGWILADALTQRELDHGLLVSPFEQALNGYGYAIESAKSHFEKSVVVKLRNWLCENADRFNQNIVK